jgi:hypothetical protein
MSNNNYCVLMYQLDCGGDRVAWNKQWFASHDIWTYRAHFDERVSQIHYAKVS